MYIKAFRALLQSWRTPTRQYHWPIYFREELIGWWKDCPICKGHGYIDGYVRADYGYGHGERSNICFACGGGMSIPAFKRVRITHLTQWEKALHVVGVAVALFAAVVTAIKIARKLHSNIAYEAFSTAVAGYGGYGGWKWYRYSGDRSAYMAHLKREITRLSERLEGQ
jgi:hypothetical protein